MRLSLHGNLIDAALVAAAFEFGGEELIHDFAGHVFIDEAAGHHEHIGVVVLADEVGNFGNPAETGTNALVLVERHVDAFARTADSDAGEYFTFLDTAREGMTEVRVVARILSIGAVVLVFESFLLEILLDELFQGKASVIGGNADC